MPPERFNPSSRLCQCIFTRRRVESRHSANVGASHSPQEHCLTQTPATETRAPSETAIVHAIMRQKPNFHDLSLCAHSSETTLSEQLPSSSAANVLIAASISVLKITSCHHRFVVDTLHVREELAASTADWRRSRPARCLHRLSHPVVCADVCNSFCEGPRTCFNLVGDAVLASG